MAGKHPRSNSANILKALEAKLAGRFQDKTLFLFVENLDMLFEGLGDDGQKQWRGFLQTHPFTSIVATSQRLFKSVQEPPAAFFWLLFTGASRPLPASDAVELLRRIARRREQAIWSSSSPRRKAAPAFERSIISRGQPSHLHRSVRDYHPRIARRAGRSV